MYAHALPAPPSRKVAEQVFTYANLSELDCSQSHWDIEAAELGGPEW